MRSILIGVSTALIAAGCGAEPTGTSSQQPEKPTETTTQALYSGPKYQFDFAARPMGSVVGALADSGQAVTTSWWSDDAVPTISGFGMYPANGGACTAGLMTFGAPTSTSGTSAYVTAPLSDNSYVAWARTSFTIWKGDVSGNASAAALVLWNKNLPQGQMSTPNAQSPVHLVFTQSDYQLMTYDTTASNPGVLLVQQYYNTALSDGQTATVELSINYSTNKITIKDPNGTVRTHGPYTKLQTWKPKYVTAEPYRATIGTGQVTIHKVQAHDSVWTGP